MFHIYVTHISNTKSLCTVLEKSLKSRARPNCTGSMSR